MKLDFKSLGGKLWVYFSFLAVVIIILVWLLQIVFLSSFYEGMKIKTIEAAANEIVSEYGTDNFLSTVDRITYRNFILVYVTDKNGDITYTSDEHGPRNRHDKPGSGGMSEGRPLPGDYYEFLNRLLSSDKNTIFYKESRNNQNTLIYGVEMSEKTVLYISTPLEPLDATVSILSTQLIYVTIISLLLGFIIAFFLAKKLSKPIVKVTKTAERLAQGDYTVCFENGNYTEIDTLSATMNYTARELSKMENLRRELIANISHDLRTPLTMIKGYSEMIEEVSGDDKEKRLKHIAIIKEESARLERLVNDILDLSTLQAGCENVLLENINLSLTVKSVIARFEAFSERDGYTIKSHIEHDKYVMADKKRIEQVLYNLIGNAFNYAGEDKIVTVSLSDMGSKVCFEVRDNGSGISEDDMPYIWDRYYKAKNHKQPEVGTGIGLSIVKSILTLHKAEFGVRSDPGIGTVFWFKLRK